ncbi:MAG: regulator of sirC expression with transglutaminase-like and TPR domain [Bradymonadia bacterium]|jgi:regulator of sirC expression with transglutaminase-like and TPR domain
MSTHATSLWDSGRDDWAAACKLAVDADDLAGALFVIAHALPADQRAARVRMSAWSQTVIKQRLAGQSGVEALRLVLVHGADLEGATADYFDLQNSDLARVIERRKGMPILLSAIWMIVGLQAGIEVHGVGLPGHFIVRVDDTLIDAFGGGRTMSVDDCQALAKQAMGESMAWDDRMLTPVTVGSLVGRVLRNLIGSAQRADDTVALYRYARLGAVLAPTDANALLTWGRAAELIGARGEAAQVYAQVVQRFEGSRQSQVAQVRAVALAGHRGSLH